MIFHNKVYDVTQFLDMHPGGEIIFEGAGTDATKMFEENLHSDEARELLAKYLIGQLPAEEHEEYKK